MRTEIKLLLLVLVSILAIVFTSCSKESLPSQPISPLTHNLVFIITTDEPVSSYTIESKGVAGVWMFACNVLAVDEYVKGMFPIGSSTEGYIDYRIVPIYSYGRGIPSIVVPF